MALKFVAHLRVYLSEKSVAPLVVARSHWHETLVCSENEGRKSFLAAFESLGASKNYTTISLFVRCM
jgi:hypothetical protein